jgi:hypothetical protein
MGTNKPIVPTELEAIDAYKDITLTKTNVGNSGHPIPSSEYLAPNNARLNKN